MQTRTTLRVLVSVVAAALMVACSGGSKSPTSPSSTSSTAGTTRIIGITGSLAFGDVTVGQSKEMTVTIANTGTGTLTMGDVSAPASAASSLSATLPRTIAPGGSATATIKFTPQSVGSFSGTITFQADHTSGTNTMAFSGAGVAAPTPPVTVFGVVTDRASGRALSGVRVSALTSSVANVGSATTDGNGYYSMVVPSATSLSVSYSLTGYDLVSSTLTFTVDTRRDVTLAVASPALEYRVSGTGAAISAGLTYANCSAGTSQSSDASLPWSFTCSSIPSGQFLYISAQNNRNSGCVKSQIYKRGVLYKESESCGAFVIATASGTY